MSKREDASIIQDMKEAIERIMSYTSKMEYDDFLHDYKTQDAVVRNIEILGEAAKLLSDETKKSYPNIQNLSCQKVIPIYTFATHTP